MDFHQRLLSTISSDTQLIRITALKASLSNQKDSIQLVGFRLADQEYAIPIEKIQEIVILESITRTPQVEQYVEGVSNLRGTIIPVINLRKLFGFESHPIDSESRTIVLNVGDRIMGCIVDSMTQVMRIPSTEIQVAPELVAGRNQAYISGFTKLDNRLLILLDVDELLDPAKLQRDALMTRQADQRAGGEEGAA